MPFTRRDLFRTAGVAGTGFLLAACGTSGPVSAPVAGAGASAARRGGVLKAVFTGGGAGESLDPYTGGSPIDFVRHDVLFDSLFTLDKAEVVPGLALAAEPAPDGRSFVLRLRGDVRWHDGTAFTAQDVAYSFRYMNAPERAYPSQLGSFVDSAAVRVRDALTLEVPTKQALGDPALFLAAFPAKIVKDGATSFTAATTVGTGAYRVTAFEAGREARLARFDGYWGGPAPADELVLLSLTDPQAKVNTVVTGQADFAGDIPFTTAKTGVASGDLEIRTAGDDHRTAFGFVLNPALKPFDDPRVRKAVRLAIDRQALVDTVLLGYGAVGNDLLCAGAKYFATKEPLARDLDKARGLVREAGAEGAEVTIRTAEYEIGYNASTQLLAEQLKAIGLVVKPQIVGPAEFFRPEAVAAAHGVAFSSGAVPLAVMYGRLAGFPGLAFPDERFKAAFGTAIASTDEGTRAKAWAEVQDVMFDRGNTIVWGQADVLSLARKAVAGITVRDQAKYPYLGKAGMA
ncbi:ABC transporter substrate-binding protein [Amycolatopsis sp. WAC 04182]|uniref:ABC transporter substrate-binding protein n=1 Tax=Amycolatopsis sp. WAC 04182 TaxID=2203198 RepID=UPI000F76E6DC|nr:ABC transporter substrate-binding protein [Amycolatopsis sp. WAC 04182]RSN63561.1 ABC transporter substrate-binding protein [Amycolatopsis sp. WAC 04182]